MSYDDHYYYETAFSTRGVLKAARRLKPEKPPKRLPIRRWHTIQVSKDQLTLCPLTFSSNNNVIFDKPLKNEEIS